MADRLEMHVLAVGQGSCGLVCHYDESGELVQLDLCDCGRTGGMDAEFLRRQMQLIHSLMERRASTVAGTDLYLDNIIISHKDADHLNLFTERYFLAGCTPSPNADKPLEGSRKRRSRSISRPGLQAAADGGEDKDHVVLLEAEYTESGIETASVDYERSNWEEDPVWRSVLTYRQKYEITKEKRAAVTEPFTCHITLNTDKYPCIDGCRCNYFSLLLEASPETGYVLWRVSGLIEVLSTKEHCGFGVYLTQQNRDSEPGISFTIHMEQYNADGGISPYPDSSIAFCWDPSLLAKLDGLAHEYIQRLCTDDLPAIFDDMTPEETEQMRKCLNMILGLSVQAFQKMSDELPPVFNLFAGVDCDTICRRLFGRASAPGNSRSLTVGNIYLGGLELSKSTTTAKNAVKRLTAFCPQDIQLVSEIVKGQGGILLLQMPLDWRDWPNWNGLYGFRRFSGAGGFSTSLLHPYKDSFFIVDDFARMSLEENSRSILYMAPDRNGYRAVFPGDATGDTMVYFLCDAVPSLNEDGIYLDKTWLCAPHHGSWNTCQGSALTDGCNPLDDYLQELSPNFVLISSGFLNKFSHPRVEFAASAFAHLEYGQSVSPHLIMCGHDENEVWTLLRTDKAVYTTVSADMNSHEPYYANLSIATEAQEVTVGSPLPCPTPSSDKNIEYAEEMYFTCGAARPPCGDVFPFLFDEPAGTPAL